MKKKCVIFLASNNANFQEMNFVARHMVDAKLATPYFLFERFLNVSLREEVDTSGFHFLNKPGPLKTILQKVYSKINSKVRNRISPAQKKWLLVSRLNKRFNQCQSILEKVKPVSVVLRGDRHFGDGWEPAMIRACRLKNIPIYIINYAYTHFTKELIHKRKGKIAYDAGAHPNVINAYPSQCVTDPDGDKKYLYRPVLEIEALAHCKMLPENPWVMGGSGADFIMVESNNCKYDFLKNGVKTEKIKVTGVGAHDKLYNSYSRKKEIRAQLNEEYGFNNDQKLVIASTVPLFEEKVMSLAEARQALEVVCKVLSSGDYHCLLSFHPRMKLDQYVDIPQKYNISISCQPLSDVLPGCDLFSCSFSTTVEWAMMCRIPTVIFDFYSSIVARYSDLDGVFLVKDPASMMSKIDKIMSSEKLYGKIQNSMELQYKNFSPFDGFCIERIVNTVLSGK